MGREPTAAWHNYPSPIKDFRAQALTLQMSFLLPVILTLSPLFQQLWSPPRFPVAMVVATALEVEAWVLVEAAATPSPPAVGTA
jgi:hypothetical protein